MVQDSSFVQLTKADFEAVRKLIPRQHHSLVIDSVLQGQTPGYVFANDAQAPDKAVIWDGEHSMFVFGRQNGDQQNDALRGLFDDMIVPMAAHKEDVNDFEIQIFEDHQIEELGKVFSHHPLMIQDWRYYTIYPGDCTGADLAQERSGSVLIKKVDEELLRQEHLENLDEIKEWIESNWSSTALFLQKGFGTCVLQGDLIVSWCVADYVIGDECEIGIETDERFWRQGFGTLAVQAAIELCKQRKIRKVGWHCRESNVGSYKVAENAGFKQAASYKTMHGWFNRLDNLLVNAYHSLNELEQFDKAIEHYEQAFAMVERKNPEVEDSAIFVDGNKQWCCYSAARAWALHGSPDKALSLLHAAMAEGFDDIEELLEDDSFESLKGNARWDEYVQKLSAQIG